MLGKDDLFTTFRTTFTEIVPDTDPNRIALTDDPRDLGANSIDRVDIISETMQKSGVSVPMVSFADAATVADIIAVILGEEARA